MQIEPIKDKAFLSPYTKVVIVVSSIITFLGVQSFLILLALPSSLSLGLKILPSFFGLVITNWLLIRSNKLAWFIPMVISSINLPGSVLMMLMMVGELSRAGNSNWGGGLSYIYFIMPVITNFCCILLLIQRKVRSEFSISDNIIGGVPANVKKMIIWAIVVSVLSCYSTLLIRLNPAVLVASIPYLCGYAIVLVALYKKKQASYSILLTLIGSRGINSLISIFSDQVIDGYFFTNIVELAVAIGSIYILKNVGIFSTLKLKLDQ